MAGLNHKHTTVRSEFTTLTNLQQMILTLEAIEKEPHESDIVLLAGALKELAREVDNVRQFATGHNHCGPAFIHTSAAWPYA